MATPRFAIECLIAFAILLFSTTMVSAGLTLPLYHKLHPNLSHHWVAIADEYLKQAPYKGEITNFRGEYVVHFSVGTPPFNTFAVFDTGSKITWLQSSSCDRCFPQPPDTVYDPTRSSTFKLVACSEPDCVAWIDSGADCDHGLVADPKCLYKYWYMDGVNTSGYLATDVFTFMDAGAPETRLKVSLLFGVGTRNFGLFSKGREQIGPPGILGMSAGANPYQLELKFETELFSYCIPDDINRTGYVKFGTAAEFSGPSVKLDFHELFYVLNLTGLSFNGRTLENPKRPSWEGYKMIIDTGTPVSRLDRDILGVIVPELEELFDDSEHFSHEGYRMCWDDLSPEDEVVKSLTIAFHFGDVEFKLYQPQIWIRQRMNNALDIYCFNLVEDDSGFLKDSVLGSMQSTNKNFGFSYLTREVAIEDRMC